MPVKGEGQHDLGRFQTFSVSDEEQQESIQPDSIEGLEPPGEDELSWEGYEPPAISRSAKIALWSIAALLGLLWVVDLAQTLYQFWQIHWVLAASLGGAVLVIGLLTARALYHWLRGRDGVEWVYQLQEAASQLKDSGGATFETRHLIQKLRDYYRDTPLEAQAAKTVDGLPDYLNDRERLALFEQNFLVPLDRRAEKIIQRYSLQTAVAVAASPIPSLDALLTLWRNILMVNQISALYGVKPTLANRVRVLLKIGRALAYSGLSQGGIDLLDLSNLPYVSVGAKALQGVGAGIATARIGHSCMMHCRPIRMEDADGYFAKFLSSLKLMIGRRVVMKSTGPTERS